MLLTRRVPLVLLRGVAVALLDTSGDMIPIDSVSNPGGVPPNNNQKADKLILYQSLGYTSGDASNVSAAFDAIGNVKWYDGNFSVSGRSVLRLVVSTPATVGAYYFKTAHDVNRRDPKSWTFSCRYDSDPSW